MIPVLPQRIVTAAGDSAEVEPHDYTTTNFTLMIVVQMQKGVLVLSN